MTTTKSRTCKTALALAASAALLAACGGGGSDDRGVEVPSETRSVAASAGSDANVDNLAVLGGWLARAVMSVSGDGAFDITAERDRPQGRATDAYDGAVPLHARVASAALRLGQPTLAARERPSAVESETMPCINVGGSVTFTVNDADDNRKLSRGDGVTLSASNCVLDPGLPAANGSMQLAINEVELDSDDMPTALDASATFTKFSVGAYGTYDGEMRLWTKPEGARERARVSYRNTTVTFAGGSVVFDFDIYGLGDEAGSSFDLNGGIGINGQTYSIVSSGVMTAVGTEPPSTGALQLRDAAQDAVRLTTRNSSSFDLDFLPSGASAPTAVLPGQLWSNYLGLP